MLDQSVIEEVTKFCQEGAKFRQFAAMSVEAQIAVAAMTVWRHTHKENIPCTSVRTELMRIFGAVRGSHLYSLRVRGVCIGEPIGENAVELPKVLADLMKEFANNPPGIVEILEELERERSETTC